MAPFRVLVVDDNENVRQGLRLFVRSYPVLEWVGEAANGIEAIEKCEALNPDLVLMDMMMPELDGIAATRHICQNQPSVRVVALSQGSDPTTIQTMLKVGAIGYVLKDGSYEALARILGIEQLSPMPLSVLIIEDDPHLRGLLALEFRKNGFQVRLAAGHDALNQLENSLPDVVLLDLYEPDTAELVQYIRQHEGGKRVHIVVFTENHYADADYVDCYRPKPVTEVDLASVVQRVREATWHKYNR